MEKFADNNDKGKTVGKLYWSIIFALIFLDHVLWSVLMSWRQYCILYISNFLIFKVLFNCRSNRLTKTKENQDLEIIGYSRQIKPQLWYLGHQRLSVLQPAVGWLGLPTGPALPEEVLLDGQRGVRHGLQPVGFGCGRKRAEDEPLKSFNQGSGGLAKATLSLSRCLSGVNLTAGRR